MLAERARSATGGELLELIHDASEEVLADVLENPRLNETHLCMLLERKSLSGALLERIAGQREWMRSYRVKLRVARHPHTPRLTALPLVRQLYLFDLVDVSLLPSTPAEIKRLGEELIISRLPQLPLGQKFTLARRGSARVVGALLGEGHEQVVPLALDNAFLTEAQVLKVLAREEIPAHVVAAIACHRKWSYFYNVRMALVRHPLTPLARVLSFLPDLTLRDLHELSAASTLSGSLRPYLRHEVARRARPARVRHRRRAP